MGILTSIRSTLGRVALVLMLVMSPDTGPAVAEDISGPVDIQFFWQAPAERAALDELRRAFEGRGGVWVDFPTHNAAQNRSIAFRRIVEGIAPFALQWHAGYDLRVMSDSGVIHDLAPVAAGMRWTEILSRNVLPYLGDDGEMLALPVGVHAENWAWFNSSLVRRHGGTVPGEWEAVLALLARSFEDAGPGIAMGTEPWQRMLLFSQILISEGGVEVYRALLERGDQDALADPAFSRALEIFARLRRYDRRRPDVRQWRDGTEAVARGEALVQFMGDWARPELARLGAEPGRDFECALSIGRQKRHLSVIDAFVFPRRTAGGLNRDHRRLAEAVLAPDTQVAYARRKGAIPVRADLAARIDDPCLGPGYKLYISPGASVPAAVMIARERPLAGLIDAISAFWDDTRLDPAAGLQEVRRALGATP